MALDYNLNEDSFNERVRDSYNTSNTTTNTATLSYAASDDDTTENSVADSGNVGIGIVDSGNDNSDNSDRSDNSDNSDNSDSSDSSDNSDNSINDSANDNSDYSWNNSGNDNSDHSVNDSGNDSSQNWWDSNNTSYYTDNSDNSVNAGNRSYDVGGAGGGGDATIVDQSVNANIMGGDSWIGASSQAVVASGDGAIAAGGDASFSWNIDNSRDIYSEDGDVNVGNTTTVTTVSDSNNDYTDSSSYDDSSQSYSWDDSANDYSQNYDATGSFNEEVNSTDTLTWDVDANVIWDSSNAIVVDDTDVTL